MKKTLGAVFMQHLHLPLVSMQWLIFNLQDLQEHFLNNHRLWEPNIVIVCIQSLQNLLILLIVCVHHNAKLCAITACFADISLTINLKVKIYHLYLHICPVCSIVGLLLYVVGHYMRTSNWCNTHVITVPLTFLHCNTMKCPYIHIVFSISKYTRQRAVNDKI